MTNGDIPSWLSKHPDRATRCSTPGKKSDRPLACFADRGADIWGLVPKGRAHAATLLGGSETKGRAALEAGNTIYSYPSKAKAKKAWKDFTQKAATCPADATIVRGDKTEQITIRQQLVPSKISKFKGQAGFAQTRELTITGKGIKKFRAEVSNYVTWRPVGKTIVRVYLNRSTQIKASTTLSAKQQAWVRKESLTVSKRVLKQKLLR